MGISCTRYTKGNFMQGKVQSSRGQIEVNVGKPGNTQKTEILNFYELSDFRFNLR